MINYEEYLKATPSGVLATIDGEGIKTRILQYLFSDGNKAYFSTSSKKPVFAQLQSNPNATFCTHPADFGLVLSISGKTVFVDDIALKTRALEENPHKMKIYGAPDNPEFMLFYIDVKEVRTFSFKEGSKTYNV